MSEFEDVFVWAWGVLFAIAYWRSNPKQPDEKRGGIAAVHFLIAPVVGIIVYYLWSVLLGKGEWSGAVSVATLWAAVSWRSWRWRAKEAAAASPDLSDAPWLDDDLDAAEHRDNSWYEEDEEDDHQLRIPTKPKAEYARVSFDYMDKEGARTHRTVVVVRIERDRISAYDEDKQALRTFLFRGLQSDFTVMDTGEIMSLSSWREAQL